MDNPSPLELSRRTLFVCACMGTDIVLHVGLGSGNENLMLVTLRDRGGRNHVQSSYRWSKVQ
jgi:hypothetical protein